MHSLCEKTEAFRTYLRLCTACRPTVKILRTTNPILQRPVIKFRLMHWRIASQIYNHINRLEPEILMRLVGKRVARQHIRWTRTRAWMLTSRVKILTRFWNTKHTFKATAKKTNFPDLWSTRASNFREIRWRNTNSTLSSTIWKTETREKSKKTPHLPKWCTLFFK